MGQPVARVGDSVQYCCQIGDDIICGTGFISGGSPNVKANTQDVARNGDPVNCGPCGTGNIIASGQTNVNGIKIALIGDTVILPTGSGTIVSASPNVFSS